MPLLELVTQFWSNWGLRISVLVSLAAYVLGGLLSRTRRRSASGSLWILKWALRIILWFMYQLTEISASGALGNLSLSGADADASGEEEEEQLLIAFWAPFLLLHLGGPDNLSAYDLEDNMLSYRKMIEIFLELVGVLYAIWNYIYRSHTHSRLLFAAAVIVLFEGATRYVERACTLWLANLEKMQEQHYSSKKLAAEPVGSSSSLTTTSAAVACNSSSSRAAAVESTISRYEGGRVLDDSDALLLAQDLHEVWRRFLVDASVDPRSRWQRASEKLLSLPWEKMCKVVEMELSLMYEVLYTKAAVVHTWAGYLIRFMSPLCSAAAASLLWLHLHRDRGGNSKGRHHIEASASFVVITYLLLGAAFALDVVWLLRALGSTWTYGYLKKKLVPPPRRPWPWAWSWLHHHALCAGWWRRLHRAVVYLDPLRLAFGIDPVAYRTWSGTIGRYNLLHECTIPHRPCRRWLANKLGLQEKKYLSELPPKVKQLLFKRVLKILPTKAGNPARPPDGLDAYTMMDITTRWGHEAIRRGAKLFRRPDDEPIPGREFEQDVLVWHMGTCTFLSRGMVRKKIAKSSTAADHVMAIEAMSEYLMFLVAERRHMLPGLALHSQLEETRRTLEEIWDGRKGTTTSAAAGGHEDDKDKLARLVQQNRIQDRSWLETEDSRRLVLDAAEVDGALARGSTRKGKEVFLVQMLELIFNVWVDKLLYAAVRCSRESHAKQLSRGGELTTVLWIVIQHAGPFRIGQRKPSHRKEDKKPEEKKPAEEKKPEKEPYPYPYPYPYPSPYPYPPPPQWLPAPAPAPPPMPPLAKEEPPRLKPDEAEVSQMPIPEAEGEELDPEDAEDSELPIRFITLY